MKGTRAGGLAFGECGVGDSIQVSNTEIEQIIEFGIQESRQTSRTSKPFVGSFFPLKGTPNDAATTRLTTTQSKPVLGKTHGPSGPGSRGEYISLAAELPVGGDSSIAPVWVETGAGSDCGWL
jgi:hypothetical protein